MKKGKVEVLLVSILCAVVFFGALAYFLSNKHEKQNRFFVNSCVNAFYNEGNYNFNYVMNGFVAELPQGMQDYIGREFGNDYLAVMSSEKVENFCGSIYEFYRGDLEEGEYDPCGGNRCR